MDETTLSPSPEMTSAVATDLSWLYQRKSVIDDLIRSLERYQAVGRVRCHRKAS